MALADDFHQHRGHDGLIYLGDIGQDVSHKVHTREVTPLSTWLGCTTASSAFSDRFLGSSRVPKNVPSRSLGRLSGISPTHVSHILCR